jgi:hypothetical protein
MTAGGVLVSVTSVMAVSAGWEHPRAWCRQSGPEPGKTLRYLVAWRPAPPGTGRYRVSPDFPPPHGRTIARADVAHFIAATLAENTWLHEAPAVAY